VFGGGGAKSLAHAGAWKALLEAGIRPIHIVGTSMGAVMGAAFAAGSSYDRLVGIALSLHRNDFAALDAWALAKGVFARSTLKPEPLKPRRSPRGRATTGSSGSRSHSTGTTLPPSTPGRSRRACSPAAP